MLNHTETLLHCHLLKFSTSHMLPQQMLIKMIIKMEAFQIGKLRSKFRISLKCPPGELNPFQINNRSLFFSWGSPQKSYAQNNGQQNNMNPRGGYSGGPQRGRGGYGPRTPQGQRPPRPHFHSEGPYGRGRGGPRGGRGFFTPR